MTLSIGRRIGELRRAKHMTQEDVGTAIGVSAAAVSKWETGQSYPDIVLLPRLARLLGVTVDDLLAYVPILDDTAREALYEQIGHAFACEGWTQGLALAEATLREYPDDQALRLLFSGSLMQNLLFAPDEEARAQGRDAQVRWLEEAAATEGGMQAQARQILVSLYMQRKAFDRAEALLAQLDQEIPTVAQAAVNLHLLQEDYGEAGRLAEVLLHSSVVAAFGALKAQVTIAIRREAPEEAQRYAAQAQALVEAVGMADSFRGMVAQTWVAVAWAMQDKDMFFDAAQTLVEAMRTLMQGDAPEDAAREVAMMETLKQDFLQNPQYDPWREDERFDRLLAQLNAK